MQDYQEISIKTKNTADMILREKKVLETLGNYGKVIITGSYAYDLMYGPDIDIVVVCENPEETSYKVLKDFIEQKSFQKYQLGDFKNYPRKNRPESFIVVLILEVEGRRWEIEIWFHKNYPEDIIMIDNMMKNISTEEKDNIIRLKHEREIKGLGKRLSSVEIYDGVLSEGKGEIGEFMEKRY